MKESKRIIEFVEAGKIRFQKTVPRYNLCESIIGEYQMH